MLKDNQNNTYTISFDFYGNMYIENISDNKIYQVNIDGRNKPYLERGDYSIIDNLKQVKRKTFKLFDKNVCLKTKLQEKLKEDKFDFDAYDPEDDEEYVDYYPEDDDHIDDNIDSDSDGIIDEDLINKYGENNLQFSFWGNDDIKIHQRENGDIMSLYDTYIYDQYQNLIFKSCAKNDSSVYRMKIDNSTNSIIFRPIGFQEIIYKLLLDENNELIINQKI